MTQPAIDVLAECAPGLQRLLRAELEGLGWEELCPTPRGVAGRTAWAGVLRAHLHSGVASRILVVLDRFRAKDFRALRRHLATLPFDAWLRRGSAVEVSAQSRASRLWHTGAVEERARDVLLEVLGGAAADPGDAVPRPGLRLQLRDDVCTVLLDVTGRPLHRRGWRQETAKAPLREDLAWALVLAAGADRAAPLLDPLCGSGTIAVSAALLARRRAPGLGQRFAFEALAPFDASEWQRLGAAAVALEVEAPPVVFASDRDPGAVAATAANAERAGVGSGVHAAVAPLSGAPGWEGGARAVVTNPPYGRRIGAVERLLPLYQTLGHRARGLPDGSAVALVAADRRLALRTGLPLRTAFTTLHGGAEVRALVGRT